MFDIPPFLMIVVPVDVLVALLLLLTDRLSGTFNILIPRFCIVAAGLEKFADGLVAFRPVLAFARVGLTLSFVILVKLAMAVIAVAFAGEADLNGGIGFSGEAWREMYDF